MSPPDPDPPHTTPPLLRLPHDLLTTIAHPLPPPHLLSLLRTCRRLYCVLHPHYLTLSASHPASLLSAIVRLNIPLTTALLAAGASPDTADPHGISALEHAARAGSTEIVVALVAAGATVVARKGGRQFPLFSPLDLAAKGGHTEVMAVLVSELAERYGTPEMEEAVGRALVLAVSERREGAVEWVLRRGGRVSKERLGEALHKAVAINAVGVMALLVGGGAEVDGRAGGVTPLQRAAERGREHMVGLLLAHGADANAVDGVGLTPLHYAVRGNAVGVVECLLEGGADVDKASALGSPFEAAVRRGWGAGVEAMARWGLEGWDLVAVWGFVKQKRNRALDEGFLRAVAEVFGEDVAEGLVEGRYG